jgi:hypothetical protein
MSPQCLTLLFRLKVEAQLAELRREKEIEQMKKFREMSKNRYRNDLAYCVANILLYCVAKHTSLLNNKLTNLVINKTTYLSGQERNMQL